MTTLDNENMDNEGMDNEDLEHLAFLAEGNLPDFIKDLPKENLKSLRNFVTKVVDNETAGLDKFFESISTSLKYIPNFIVLSITNKYVEPGVGARICEKLTTKQSLKVAHGLPAAYAGEAARYMKSELMAELFDGLKKDKAEEIIRYVAEHNPIKILDFVEHVSMDTLKKFKGVVDLSLFDKLNLTSSSRRAALEKLKSL